MNGNTTAKAAAKCSEVPVASDTHETSSTGSDDLPGALSADDTDAPTLTGIDYSNLEETPYEHGFEPGDHIIRWDMLPILWPIQIHGIVLEVSDDGTTVTICDFGITTAKKNDDAKSNSENVEKIVADDDAKFKEAIQDLSNEGGTPEATKKKAKKRLNIIVLTKWSDLRKWSKVNYERQLIPGGVGKSLKGLGEKTEKLWTSTKQLFVRKEFSELPDDALNDDDSLTDLMDEQMKIVEAVIRKDSKGSQKNAETDQKIVVSPSNAKEQVLNEFITEDSKGENVSEQPEATQEDSNDSKTLAQMVAEANEVDKNSPRKIVIKSPPQSPTKQPNEEKQQSWHGSFMKSLSNMNVFAQSDGRKGLFPRSSSKGSEGGQDVAPPKKDTSTPNLPRSDPAILVLARTRFLLDQGEDFLPPYHIVNSNSECIAVWCKTGRWSTLQASVFLHSTAIGNTKSTTAAALAVAATQPWLLGVVIPAGMTAIGTPWIMLKVANDKWNQYTATLTDAFWSRAEPEVFVECIEKWGQKVNKE